MLYCSPLVPVSLIREENPRFHIVKALTRPTTIFLDAIHKGSGITSHCSIEKEDVIRIYHMGDGWCTDTSINSTNIFLFELFHNEPRQNFLPNDEKVGR